MTTANDIFTNVLALAKDDLLKAVLPDVVTFLNSVSANPTAINFAAASAKLQVDFLTALPTIEQAVLISIAQQVSALATAALPAA